MNKPNPSSDQAKSKNIAVILVRGLARIRKPIKDTILMLKLKKKHQCVIVEDTPMNKGMLVKVKDYIAWGPINEETYKLLIQKRGKAYEGRLTDRKEKYHYKTLSFSGKHYLPYFRLNPPKKGFGIKGIKVAYNASGSLGNRGEKINDLIKRMV